jgi:hypothetical protein
MAMSRETRIIQDRDIGAVGTFARRSRTGDANALPRGIHIVENPDIVAIKCLSCGWRAEYSAAGASRDEMVTDAAEHDCGGLDVELHRLVASPARMAVAPQ